MFNLDSSKYFTKSDTIAQDGFDNDCEERNDASENRIPRKIRNSALPPSAKEENAIQAAISNLSSQVG